MRSIEYDTVSDRYARFLMEEVLPEVEKTYKLRPGRLQPRDRRVNPPAASARSTWPG